MRIVAGQFKGRQLVSPAGSSTRPTSDQVREAIFNLIGARFPIRNATVLDLFCGTGALGLEAISRGAAHVTFVDGSAAALRATRRNIAMLQVESRCSVLQRDAARYVKGTHDHRFDLILADPPYKMPGIEEIAGFALDLLTDDGLMVFEHDRNVSFDDSKSEIESRSYGRTIVTIFRRSSEGLSKQP